MGDMNKSKIVAIVPAGGAGTRMGDTLPKQYLDINGKPMISHTLSVLASIPRISRVVVVNAPNDVYFPRLIDVESPDYAGKIASRNVGGQTRAQSVLNGLLSLGDDFADTDWALVHDAARPCVTPRLIEQFLDELEDEPIGGLLALPVADTLKRGNTDQRVEETVDRSTLWRAQTPQMFRLGLLRRALTQSHQATDEAQAVERLGHQPRLVVGDSANLKVTYATDLKLASLLLLERTT